MDNLQSDKTKKDLTCDADGKCHCKCDVCGDKCDGCCEGHKGYPKCEGDLKKKFLIIILIEFEDRCQNGPVCS